MTYLWKYETPEGFSDMYMNSDGSYLTGLWFEGSRDSSKHVTDGEEKDLPVFRETCRWLDIYYSGQEPDFTPAYRIRYLTDFRSEVIERMKAIPYGQLVSYQSIAQDIAQHRGIARMSARAVGGAVGWNPLCIIIPCHRVVGSNGSLTGYGGGIKNKISLLRLEGHEMDQLKV